MNMEIQSCRGAWERMTEISKSQSVRNYVQCLDMSDFLVVTDTFPEDVLLAYSAYNLGKDLTAEQKSFMNANRGGAQSSGTSERDNPHAVVPQKGTIRK